MGFHIYEMSVLDMLRPLPQAAVATGGTLMICTAGTARKATLYNPASDFVALTNPISFSRGRVRFATLDTVLSVDIYGFAPTGHFIAFRGVKPGAEGEFAVNTTQRMQVAHIPFYAADYTAASENDSGLDMPVGAAIIPGISMRVTAIDATETLEVGLLSSEAGGDADGLLDAIDMANLGTIAPSLTGTPTLGALVRSMAGTSPDVALARVYPIGTAVSISFTPTAGSDTGEGFVQIPYVLPPL